MTDEERQAELERVRALERLLQVWRANPTLRLAQLVGNVFPHPGNRDPYYLEDHQYLAAIEHYYAADQDTQPVPLRLT